MRHQKQPLIAKVALYKSVQRSHGATVNTNMASVHSPIRRIIACTFGRDIVISLRIKGRIGDAQPVNISCG